MLITRSFVSLPSSKRLQSLWLMKSGCVWGCLGWSLTMIRRNTAKQGPSPTSTPWNKHGISQNERGKGREQVVMP